MNIDPSRLRKQPVKKTGLYSTYFPPDSLKRKIVNYAGIPLLIFFVMVLIADVIVMPIITRHGEEFELPDFTNQKVVKIQLTLKELSLNHEISSEEYSPGKEKGYILSQIPMAGTKVKKGRLVKFVISLGQKNVPIPELAGLSVRQAMLNLETAGLTLGEIAWAFSDTLPEKVVVFSYPNAKMDVPLGSAVNLMVNRGRASNFTFMPKIIGLTLLEAKSLLVDKGLKTGLVKQRSDDNYLPETVLEQSEPEGAELDLGTEIDLVVSKT